MWGLLFSPGNLTHYLLATGCAALQSVYYGFLLESKFLKVASLSILISCTMGIILVPYFYGFSLFGDASRHLIWIEEIVNGEKALLPSYYLSWYAISVVLVKYLHFPLDWLLVVYPVVTYTAFLFGFYLLARVVGKSNSEKWAIFIPSTLFLFGLGNIAMVPFYFGVMLVPAFIALQFMLANKFRISLAVSSLGLFGIISFSHPFNFLFCFLFLLTFWLFKKGWRWYCLLALGAILVVVVLNFVLNPRLTSLVNNLNAIFFDGAVLFPVFGSAPYISILVTAQISLLLAGVVASVYFIRKREYLSVVALFCAGLAIGLCSISGVLIVRGFTRMFAYAFIMSLVLLGLFLRDLLLTKPRAAKWLFVYVVAYYLLSTYGVVVRFEGLYYHSMRFD